MQQFKQGDTVRTKSGGPVMAVDGYTPEGEVICTYWDKSKRLQEKFVEETLQAAHPDDAKRKVGVHWLGRKS
jgi:uncharacterized protein YodC (DUF2158 family)